MSIETMTKIATYTVGAGGIASYTFTNIRQDFTDLVIIGSVRTNRASTDEDGLAMVVNGFNTGYTYRGLMSNGSSASSVNTSFEQPWFTRVPASTATANIFGNFKVYIPQYSKFMQKSYYVDGVQENNASIGYSNLMAITNTTTLPITSLEFKSATGATMQQYSTITIYGIKNAAQTAGNSIKATGGAISFDGTYVVHTFNSSGTFTPTTGLNVDYLVVAGGGGGGPADDASGMNGNRSGGGGAGGFRCTVGSTGGGGSPEPKIYLSSGSSYSVIVGSGGSGTAAAPTSGSSSSFFTITSLGGGVGGGLNSVPNWFAAGSGGSGGGGGEGIAGAGAGTANQGFAGGSANESQGAGGGGGGAGSIGQTAPNSNTGGNGGSGVSTSISGSSVFYAGGGGGSSPATQGIGGSGGGGSASKSSTGGSGTPNTGGGGGSGSRNGGNGGSGIVIIRYLAQ